MKKNSTTQKDLFETAVLVMLLIVMVLLKIFVH